MANADVVNVSTDKQRGVQILTKKTTEKAVSFVIIGQYLWLIHLSCSK